MASRLVEVVVCFLFIVAVVSADDKSIYNRWGSSKCGANSELVYDGIVGGGVFALAGSAVNSVCLPKDPVFKQYSKNVRYPDRAYIYGAEYQMIMSGSRNYKVPCAVCLSKGSTIMMIPAKLTCPQKWKTEYTGFLSAGATSHRSGTEYVCIDESLEKKGGNKYFHGKLFYHVAVRCGSLPCSIYPNEKILPCVVCSL